MKKESEEMGEVIFLNQYVSSSQHVGMDGIFEMIPDPTPREEILIGIIETMGIFISEMCEDIKLHDMGIKEQHMKSKKDLDKER